VRATWAHYREDPEGQADRLRQEFRLSRALHGPRSFRSVQVAQRRLVYRGHPVLLLNLALRLAQLHPVARLGQVPRLDLGVPVHRAYLVHQ